MSSDTLDCAIEQGRGPSAADLVLKGGRVLDLVTGALLDGDVAIAGDRIVGTCDDYRGRRELDARGKVVAPGFIDTHLPTESSLVTQQEFDRRSEEHTSELQSLMRN